MFIKQKNADKNVSAVLPADNAAANADAPEIQKNKKSKGYCIS